MTDRAWLIEHGLDPDSGPFKAVHQSGVGNRIYECETCGWRTPLVTDGRRLARILRQHQGFHPKDRLDLVMGTG